MPKIVFPVAVVISNLTNFSFFLIAYFVITALTPIGLSPINVMVIPVIGMVSLLSIGGALIMATLNVFFRDFLHLTEVILRLMFYLTPILYRPELFGEKAQFFFQLNPAYYPIVTARSVLYDQVMPDPHLWVIGYATAFASCVLGLFIFTRTQDKFVYYA